MGNLLHQFKSLCSLCFFCRAKTADLWCADCELDLGIHYNRCLKCGSLASQAQACSKCAREFSLFHSTTVLFSYRYPADRLIQIFKFNSQPGLAHSIVDHLIKKIKTPLPQYIVPVPLHKKRQQKRGYNQSAILARLIAKKLNITSCLSSVLKTKDTPPQSSLDSKLRKKNISNSFSLKKPISASHIAIIDDVTTTGSTVKELAKLLKKSGIEKIDLWIIAKVDKNL